MLYIAQTCHLTMGREVLKELKLDENHLYHHSNLIHCSQAWHPPDFPQQRLQEICPAQPATLNRLTNGYGRRRNLILLNFLVKSNLNSFCSPAEKYNISNRHSSFDREILILLIISRSSSFAFMQPSQVSRLNKLMGRRGEDKKSQGKLVCMVSIRRGEGHFNDLIGPFRR